MPMSIRLPASISAYFSAPVVSGNFHGSPLLLDHAFTLTGQKISRLEIR
jgi:hypothetical protein